jgi:hypothetical protein
MFYQSATVHGRFMYIPKVDFSGLVVVDVSDPSRPVPGERVALETSSAPCVVSPAGDTLFVPLRTGGVALLDLADPSRPVLESKIECYTPQGIVLAGDMAYVGCGGAGMVIADVSDPGHPALRGAMDAVEDWNKPPVVFYQGGAIDGQTLCFADPVNGLRVFDLSDRAAPALLAVLPLRWSPKEVLALDGYAYVCSYTSVQVVDLRTPSAPKLVRTFDVAGDGGRVSEVPGFAFLADYTAGVRIVDVKDPAHPVEISRYSPDGTIAWDAVPSADGRRLFVPYSTIAWTGNRPSGLAIVDIGDPRSPRTLGKAVLPGSPRCVALAGEYVYVGGGDGCGLSIIRVSDPAHPRLVGRVNFADDPQAIFIEGGFAYLAGQELRIIDVRSPSAPVQVGSMPLGGGLSGLAVQGKIAYVSAAVKTGGLLAVDVSRPGSPVVLATLPGRAASGLEIRDSRLYAANYFGTQVFDIADPRNPRPLLSFDLGTTSVWDVAVRDDLLYLSSIYGSETLLQVFRLGELK